MKLIEIAEFPGINLYQGVSEQRLIRRIASGESAEANQIDILIQWY